jgi:hypothetical protein
MTDDDKPPWNDKLARQFIGKHIIIGITRLTADDEPLGQQQMHGDIVAVDEMKGICIRLAGSGEMHWLPPDLRSIRVAPLGEYRFRSTGEVVVNPDLMTTWTIKSPRLH